METLEENIKILDSFLELEYNWNDYGAKPFTKKYIESVKKFIQTLKPQPQLFPTAAQSIHLEYDKDNEVLIFDYRKSEVINYYRKFKDGNSVERLFLKNKIQKEIDDFYSTK